MLKIWNKMAELINYNVKINGMIRYIKEMIIQSYAILDVSIYLQMGIYQYISPEKNVFFDFEMYKESDFCGTLPNNRKLRVAKCRLNS